jgi:excisionase family DNA binding protein
MPRVRLLLTLISILAILIDVKTRTVFARKERDMYMTLTEAAEMLGITRQRTHQFITEKRIPAELLGSVYMLRREDVEAFRAWREGHRRDAWKLALLHITDSPDGAYFVLPSVTREGASGVYGSPHYVAILEQASGWRAHVMDMPCEATGATREEVEKNLLDAVRAHIARNLAEDPADKRRAEDAA